MRTKSSPSRKFAPWHWALLGIVASIGWALPARINVTVTPSLDRRVFFLTGRPAQGELHSGDYVLFNEAHPWSGQAATMMTKRIACQPGDRLTVTETHDYFCNGTYLGRALPADANGTPLPAFSFDGIIPAGQYFLSGGHPRSYDSRYYGLVTHERFAHKALPIF
jgi:hypothetical protein